MFGRQRECRYPRHDPCLTLVPNLHRQLARPARSRARRSTGRRCDGRRDGIPDTHPGEPSRASRWPPTARSGSPNGARTRSGCSRTVRSASTHSRMQALLRSGSRPVPTGTCGSPSAPGTGIGSITSTGAITEYPLPTASSQPGDHHRPGRSPVVHRTVRESDRTHHHAGADHRVPPASRRVRTDRDRPGPRRCPVVHRADRQPDRADHDLRTVHRVPAGVLEPPADRHHRGG